jgi:hypothetical protein
MSTMAFARRIGLGIGDVRSHRSPRFERHAPQQCRRPMQAEDKDEGTGIYDERL